ncbi:MAG TPA: O-antigen ligase family protein [Terriglobales bacterium]|nr:O-antigen ligase family protein [Terriglobales bacterium]
MDLSARRPEQVFAELACHAAVLPARVIQAFIQARWLLFLAMLSFMLFRPPGSNFFPCDRIAFVLVCIAAALHITTTGQPFSFLRPVTLPMAGLLLLSSCNLLHPCDSAESWSMFATRWLIPFTVYQLAARIFPSARSRRAFEIFTLMVLAYLSLISIAFLVGAGWAIFPSYILDPGFGIHADRARGPFLQAVANGMALNLLFLIALNALVNRRLRMALALPLLAAVPIAIVATMTRAVWLSFAGTAVLLGFSRYLPLRRVCAGFLIATLICVGALFVFPQQSIADRIQDRSPVEFRVAVYEAGLRMFGEKPLLGWGSDRMRNELARRISDFHQEDFYFHNTYLEVMVERGLLGLFLYAWMAIDLFSLARTRLRLPWAGFPDLSFRAIWPLMLVVYFVNASFVGMNYQFVNVLLFTVAGLLAAQNRVEQGALRVH